MKSRKKFRINKNKKVKVFDVVFLPDKKMINRKTGKTGHYYIVSGIDNNGYVILNCITHDKKNIFKNKYKLDYFDGKSFMLNPVIVTDVNNNLVNVMECKRVYKNKLSLKDKLFIERNVIRKIKKVRKKIYKSIIK